MKFRFGKNICRHKTAVPSERSNFRKKRSIFKVNFSFCSKRLAKTFLPERRKEGHWKWSAQISLLCFFSPSVIIRMLSSAQIIRNFSGATFVLLPAPPSSSCRVSSSITCLTLLPKGCGVTWKSSYNHRKKLHTTRMKTAAETRHLNEPERKQWTK